MKITTVGEFAWRDYDYTETAGGEFCISFCPIAWIWYEGHFITKAMVVLEVQE